MNYVLRNEEIFPQGGRRQLTVTLKKGELNVLSIVYDVLLHTARVESNGVKRLFMMYVEGKRQPKTVFKNEYGFDIGSMEPTIDENGNGEIKIYSDKYYYKLPQQPGGILSVFRQPNTQPLINVVTEMLATGIFTGTRQHKLPLDFFYCILMGICWYLQLPQNKEYLKTSVPVTSQELLRV